MTPAQLHILQHSLGCDQYGRGSFYRTHFVTGEGSDDHADCNALVDAGLMVVRRGVKAMGDMDLFHVTDAGKRAMLEASPAPPKLTRGQSRYARWLEVSDLSGMSFGEWLKTEHAA